MIALRWLSENMNGRDNPNAAIVMENVAAENEMSPGASKPCVK